MNKETKRKPKKRRGVPKGTMYTSPEIQARVRAKKAKGYTNAAIGRSEGLWQGTVKKILKDEEAVELVAQANRDFKGLAEMSVKVLFDQLLENKDTVLAQSILASLGILK